MSDFPNTYKCRVIIRPDPFDEDGDSDELICFNMSADKKPSWKDIWDFGVEIGLYDQNEQRISTTASL